MEQEVIKELSTADLFERLEDESKQLVKLRLNHAVSPLENPNKIKAYRKIIARIKTELRKRELEGHKTSEIK
ncbi:MAG: 50S ribosomal protein L29 [Bacteroidales bacterium]|nr:50S ribosomal protein L29 [Bacteroidales bacterium]